MQQDEIIQDIRKRCRMAMNGIASTSMREKGLDYKLNFGLMIQQIKDLAAQYSADKDLAETLWKENTRELKIVATLLYPAAELSAETAHIWASEIPNQEIREQICINMFQYVAIADQLGIEWSNNSADMELRITGYWLLVRLLLSKKIANSLSSDYFKMIWEDVVSENIFLRNAAQLVLKHIGRQSGEEANMILEKLSIYKDDKDLLKQEAYNSIAFEFEFFKN